LTGQDIGTLGIAGSLAAGYVTANAIAGYGSPLNAILQREIVDDLGLPKIYNAVGA
jgi:hypothetical protein